MADDAPLTHLHGVRIALPFGWEDTSLYRYDAPVSEAAPAGAGKVRQLQPNVIVSRHPRKSEDAPLADFFAQTNAQALASNSSFQVLGSGSGLYLDQPMIWQDTSFVDTPSGAQVWQRQVLLRSWPRHFTLLTLTGTKQDVEQICEQMLFGDLHNPPAMELIGEGEGAIAARLAHTLEPKPK